jgi:integrase
VPVRRDPRSPFWQYRFQIRGRRFFGSTKKTTRREAERVEAAEREKARALIAQAEHARTSLRLDDVAGRYWQEHAQHLAGAPNTWTLLGVLLDFFGKDKLITDISDDDVAKLVAWRRGHRMGTNSPQTGENFPVLISPFTVNHTTTTLRKLFTRAKLWGVRFAHEPKWSRHLLKVPVERVRELSDDEADKLDAAMRDDYAPFFAFARASGLRLAECLLRWSEVDFSARQIVKLGKGGKRVAIPITTEIRDLLWPLRGHHPDFVFTYVCERGEHGQVRGERYPLTYGGVQTYWQRLRRQSGVVGFRFHDYRHDMATKLLRETGNLRLVQKALGHASIKTTTRYAHVLDSEVADAMERVAASRKPSRMKIRVVR